MSAMKVAKPAVLSTGLSDADLLIWIHTLENYLETNDAFCKFLPDGSYPEWLPMEENRQRIVTPVHPDTEYSLPRIQKELRHFYQL